MKKAILLEDRPGRQSQFLTESQIADLAAIEGLENLTGEECESVLRLINEGQWSRASNYDLIMVHKSKITAAGFIFLKELAIANQIELILFSGGQSQLSYAKEKFQLLSLNSSTFYSANFLPFLARYLNEQTVNLLELPYGEQAKLAVMLQFRLLSTLYDTIDDGSELKFRTGLTLESMRKEIGLANTETILLTITKLIEAL